MECADEVENLKTPENIRKRKNEEKNKNHKYFSNKRRFINFLCNTRLVIVYLIFFKFYVI